MSVLDNIRRAYDLARQWSERRHVQALIEKEDARRAANKENFPVKKEFERAGDPADHFPKIGNAVSEWREKNEAVLNQPQRAERREIMHESEYAETLKDFQERTGKLLKEEKALMAEKYGGKPDDYQQAAEARVRSYLAEDLKVDRKELRDLLDAHMIFSNFLHEDRDAPRWATKLEQKPGHPYLENSSAKPMTAESAKKLADAFRERQSAGGGDKGKDDERTLH